MKLLSTFLTVAVSLGQVAAMISCPSGTAYAMGQMTISLDPNDHSTVTIESGCKSCTRQVTSVKVAEGSYAAVNFQCNTESGPASGEASWPSDSSEEDDDEDECANMTMITQSKKSMMQMCSCCVDNCTALRECGVGPKPLSNEEYMAAMRGMGSSNSYGHNAGSQSGGNPSPPQWGMNMPNPGSNMNVGEENMTAEIDQFINRLGGTMAVMMMSKQEKCMGIMSLVSVLCAELKSGMDFGSMMANMSGQMGPNGMGNSGEMGSGNSGMAGGFPIGGGGMNFGGNGMSMGSIGDIGWTGEQMGTTERMPDN